MKERFNETINSIIISSIITFVVGLIMILMPKLSIETIGIKEISIAFEEELKS